MAVVIYCPPHWQQVLQNPTHDGPALIAVRYRHSEMMRSGGLAKSDASGHGCALQMDPWHESTPRWQQNQHYY